MARATSKTAQIRRTKPYNFEADLGTFKWIKYQNGIRAIIEHCKTITPATDFTPAQVELLRRELVNYVVDSRDESYDRHGRFSIVMLSEALKERAQAIKKDIVDTGEEYSKRSLNSARVALELHTLADAVRATACARNRC